MSGDTTTIKITRREDHYLTTREADVAVVELSDQGAKITTHKPLSAEEVEKIAHLVRAVSAED